MAHHPCESPQSRDDRTAVVDMQTSAVGCRSAFLSLSAGRGSKETHWCDLQLSASDNAEPPRKGVSNYFQCLALIILCIQHHGHASLVHWNNNNILIQLFKGCFLFLGEVIPPSSSLLYLPLKATHDSRHFQSRHLSRSITDTFLLPERILNGCYNVKGSGTFCVVGAKFKLFLSMLHSTSVNSIDDRFTTYHLCEIVVLSQRFPLAISSALQPEHASVPPPTSTLTSVFPWLKGKTLSTFLWINEAYRLATSQLSIFFNLNSSHLFLLPHITLSLLRCTNSPWRSLLCISCYFPPFLGPYPRSHSQTLWNNVRLQRRRRQTPPGDSSPCTASKTFLRNLEPNEILLLPTSSKTFS